VLADGMTDPHSLLAAGASSQLINYDQGSGIYILGLCEYMCVLSGMHLSDISNKREMAMQI